MALPVIGNPITMGQINEEIQHNLNQLISINSTTVRTLANVLSGPISLYNFYGKILNLAYDNGWFAGGGDLNGSRSTIERIYFAVDTSSATSRGKLNLSRRWLAGTNNKSAAWFGGGSTTTTVDKLIFATDTAGADLRGCFQTAVQALAAISDQVSNGWFVGGTTNTWGYSIGITSSIFKINFINDAYSPIYRSQLSLARASLSSVGNTTSGWFSGGYIDTNITVSRIDTLAFISDTLIAIKKGNLTSPKCDMASVGTPSDGWFIGGNVDTSSNNSSIIDRISFATDTNLAMLRSHIIVATRRMSACGNNYSAAWFGGGITTNTSQIIYKLIFATDTVPVIPRGPLVVARDSMAAV